MICKPFYYHGAIGSAYFAGWALFATVLPLRANRKGRKGVIALTFLATTVAIMFSLFNQSLEIHIAIMFCIGLFASGRVAVAFIYLMEMLTPKWGALVATISSIVYVGFFAVITAYVRLVSKDYMLITQIGVVFGFISFIGIVCFLDESPLYLLRIGEVEKAEKIIRRIYRVNKSTGNTPKGVKLGINSRLTTI